MTNLSAKYKFGFSATPKRDDGLTDVIHFATGPKVHTVPKEELTDVLIKPTYRVINTDYNLYLFSPQDYQSMITDMAEDRDRNKLIVDTWKKDYNGKSTIMLGSRLTQ